VTAASGQERHAKKPFRSINGPAREVLGAVIKATFDEIIHQDGLETSLEVNDIQCFIERHIKHTGRRCASSGAYAAAMVLWLFGFRVAR
jgi:hypothetical protein